MLDEETNFAGSVYLTTSPTYVFINVNFVSIKNEEDENSQQLLYQHRYQITTKLPTYEVKYIVRPNSDFCTFLIAQTVLRSIQKDDITAFSLDPREYECEIGVYLPHLDGYVPLESYMEDLYNPMELVINVINSKQVEISEVNRYRQLTMIKSPLNTKTLEDPNISRKWLISSNLKNGSDIAELLMNLNI